MLPPNNLKIMELLILYGADVNASFYDFSGRAITARKPLLKLAIQYQDAHVMKILVDNNVVIPEKYKHKVEKLLATLVAEHDGTINSEEKNLCKRKLG
jgi:hypothetical protein